MKSLCRRRAGIGFERKQVGDRAGGRRKFKVRSIDNSWGQRAAAGHANGLGAVMRFLPAGAAVDSGLRAAQVFGTRQFVAGVVNHFIWTKLRCSVGAESLNLPRKNGNDKYQESLQQ